MATLIGWGKRDFSLDEPVLLYGQLHLRVSEGIHDPLFATALAVTDTVTGESTVLLALDLECPHGGIIDKINELLKERMPEIPEHAVVVNATHTHGGMNLRETPDVTPDGRKIYQGKKCMLHVANCAVEAICDAWKSRKEGGITYGYGYAVVGHSRRSTYLCDMSVKMPNNVAPNGHAIMYGKTNNPDFAGYEAGADHFLNALFTTDKSGRLTGMVVNIPCPAQTSETLILQTADYWYNIRDEVKREFGEEVFLLNQCGAGGDTAPRILHYREAQRRRMALKYGAVYDESRYHEKDSRIGDERYKKCMAEQQDIAERVIECLKEVWGWAQKEIDYAATVKTEYAVLDMPRRMISKQQYEEFKEVLENLKFPERNDCKDDAEYNYLFGRASAVKRRNERAIKRYELQQKEPTIPMRMHAVRIGDVAFVTCRFELYIDFMHRLAARSPFIQTFTVQLAGDEDESYIATLRAEQNKGYSASVFCNQVSHTAGQYWVEESIKILNKLSDEA